MADIVTAVWRAGITAGLLFLAIAVAPLGGALSGWALSILMPEWISGGFAALGLHVPPSEFYKIGAIFGWVGALLKYAPNYSKNKSRSEKSSQDYYVVEHLRITEDGSAFIKGTHHKYIDHVSLNKCERQHTISPCLEKTIFYSQFPISMSVADSEISASKELVSFDDYAAADRYANELAKAKNIVPDIARETVLWTVPVERKEQAIGVLLRKSADIRQIVRFPSCFWDEKS